MFKIVPRLGQHWRFLNCGATFMTLILAGARFRDGIIVREQPREEVKQPDQSRCRCHEPRISVRRPLQPGVALLAGQDRNRVHVQSLRGRWPETAPRTN